MKIVFLNRYQDINQRGAEVFINELSKRLAKKHQVDIFSGKDADSFNKVLQGKYDLVIPVNGRWQCFKFSLGRLIGKYKMLITGHSGRGWDDILNILSHPDAFVVLTDSLAKWAKIYNWGSRIVKIPNGIDLERFSQNGSKLKIDLEKPIILSVGSLAWYKYHDRVIKAVNRLGFGSLIIVGEGGEQKNLQGLGLKLLGSRFKIMKLNYKQMPNLYRSCDLFTLPSWDREAFGLVYLEAMASGLGVVAPDDQSRREIIGNAGILADTSNLDKYASVLKEALSKNWHSKSREQAKKFSWDKIADHYEQLMLDIVRK